MIINILDKKTVSIVDFLENKNADAPVFWDDLLKMKVKNGAASFEFVTNHDASPYLANKNKLVIRHRDGYDMAFVIENVEQVSDDGREVYIYAEAEHMRLATSGFIEPIVMEGETLQTAVSTILTGTRWKPGIIEFAGTRKVAFKEFVTPLKAILELENIFDDVEVRFRVETSGGRITGRYVDFIQRVGHDRGAEVELGINLVGIERKEDSREVYTAMVGVGRGKEEGSFVTIESVNGGKKYIEDLDALQRWSDDGQHLFGIWYVESEEDTEDEITPAEVMAATQKAFRDNINSKVSYRVESVAFPEFGFEKKPRLGDTVRIKDPDFSPALYLEARAIEMEYRNEQEDVTALFGEYNEITPNVYADLKALQTKIFLKEARWNAEGLKIISSPTPPQDTSVIWAKPTTTPSGTQLEVFHKHDGTNWVATASQNAQDVSYSDNRTIEELQGKMFPPGIDGGLAISDNGKDLVARDSGGDRQLLSIDDTVATMWDGNRINPKVIAYGKHYTQRVSIYVPAGTYNPGDFIRTTVTLKDYVSVAISNVSIIKAQSLAKEFYAYEELNTRVFNGGDLQSFVLRASPHYAHTGGGENISIDIMIVGWR